jgi:PH domain
LIRCHCESYERWLGEEEEQEEATKLALDDATLKRYSSFVCVEHAELAVREMNSLQLRSTVLYWSAMMRLANRSVVNDTTLGQRLGAAEEATSIALKLYGVESAHYAVSAWRLAVLYTDAIDYQRALDRDEPKKRGDLDRVMAAADADGGVQLASSLPTSSSTRWIQRKSTSLDDDSERRRPSAGTLSVADVKRMATLRAVDANMLLRQALIIGGMRSSLSSPADALKLFEQASRHSALHPGTRIMEHAFDLVRVGEMMQRLDAGSAASRAHAERLVALVDDNGGDHDANDASDDKDGDGGGALATVAPLAYEQLLCVQMSSRDYAGASALQRKKVEAVVALSGVDSAATAAELEAAGKRFERLSNSSSPTRLSDLTMSLCCYLAAASVRRSLGADEQSDANAQRCIDIIYANRPMPRERIESIVASLLAKASASYFLDAKLTRIAMTRVLYPRTVAEEAICETMALPSRSGYLTKKGQIVHNWKRRWFVLDRDRLSYFRAPSDAEPRGSIDIGTVVRVERAHDGTASERYEHVFGIHTTAPRVFLCVAESQQELDAWTSTLNDAVQFWSEFNSELLIDGQVIDRSIV